MVIRILLLLSITWVMGLTAPLVHRAVGNEISGRDLILLVGGLFLHRQEHARDPRQARRARRGTACGEGGRVSFAAVIVQILLLDIVFSLDSVITAVGMAERRRR